jgi:hypothetical protein
MHASHSLVHGLTLCLALASALSAVGADNVLSVIPKNSLGLVVVKRIDEADHKVAEVAKLMELPAPSVLELAQLQLDLKEGIDETGSLALAVLPSEDAGGLPVPIGFVPTRDYQSFIKQLEAEDAGDAIHKVQIAGKSFVVGQKGGYAVLTPAEYETRLLEVLDSSKSVAKSIKPLQSFLAKSDIGAVVTTAGVKLSAAKALEGLAMIKAGLEQAGPEAQTAVSGLAMYEAMFEAMKESVTQVGISIRVDKDLNVHAASRVLFDSPTKEIEAQDRPKPPGIAGLPAGSFAFAFGGILPKSQWEAMLRYSVQMTRSFPGGADLTEEQIKELTRLSAESMQGVRGMSMVMGVTKPGASPYSGMCMLMHVDNAEAYMKKYAKVLRELRKWGEAAEIPLYQFADPEETQIGEATGMKIAMDLSNLLGAAGNPPEVQEMMKKLFGGEGELTIYIAPVDQRTVAMAYVSKAAVIQAIKAAQKHESSLAADPGIATTAALLRPNSQWVFYISPAGAIAFANNMVATFSPDAAPVIPEFPQTPPIGVSANGSASKVDVDLVLPASVLKAIGGYIQTVRGGG